jgi:putative flavoprotein involved in K+ transport
VFEAALRDGRRIASAAVIFATGAFAMPLPPAVSKSIARSVQQRHVSKLSNLDDAGHGTLLVIGYGASGRDVARALATSHQVILAQGRARNLLSERIFSRSV